MLLEAIEKFTHGASLFAAAAARDASAKPVVDAKRFPHMSRAHLASPSDEEAVHGEALGLILDGLRMRYGR